MALDVTADDTLMDAIAAGENAWPADYALRRVGPLRLVEHRGLHLRLRRLFRHAALRLTRQMALPATLPILLASMDHGEGEGNLGLFLLCDDRNPCVVLFPRMIEAMPQPHQFLISTLAHELAHYEGWAGGTFITEDVEAEEQRAEQRERELLYGAGFIRRLP